MWILRRRKRKGRIMNKDKRGKDIILGIGRIKCRCEELREKEEGASF